MSSCPLQLDEALDNLLTEVNKNLDLSEEVRVLKEEVVELEDENRDGERERAYYEREVSTPLSFLELCVYWSRLV